MKRPLDSHEARIVGAVAALERVPPTNCVVCGGPLAPDSSSGGCHIKRGNGADADRDCFSFKFWSEKYAWRMRKDIAWTDVPTKTLHYAVRIGGQHWVVANGMVRDHGQFMGCGGSTMCALITGGPQQGTLIKANDWWSQGDIPAAWRLLLPDNARFLTKEEYAERKARLTTIDAAPIDLDAR